MATKIYTKTGDGGLTSLIGGTRVSKASPRIEAYGTIDELNSFIGWAGDLQTDPEARQMLAEIQDRLFTIGSSLAADPGKDQKMLLPDLTEADITLLETAIDRIGERVPPLRHFVIPGGHPAVSACHIARSVARRAERLCIRLIDDGQYVGDLILPYLNRLSDYLFMLARQTAFSLKVEEKPWKPRR